jgi:hypothetical protein
MKKYILVIVILICSGWVAAQSSKSSSKGDGGRRLLFGVSVGPTVDWFAPSTNALIRKAPKAGLIAGVNVDVNLVPKDVLYFSTGVFARYLQGDVSFLNEYRFYINDFLIDETKKTTRTYQTTYLTIPTGIKFRTTPSNGCVFLGKLGLYHNFKLAGKQFDTFFISGEDTDYSITTKKLSNKDAASFAESAYAGLGFEYVFLKNLRIFANLDYGCQFNYFKPKQNKVTSNVSDAQFKAIIHSMHITVGVMF